MECIYNLKIKNEAIFFGDGIYQLLILIDKHKSINLATEEMKMSYSKAWKILKIAEKELGFKLLVTKSGGFSGGGSNLSNECIAFMEKYEKFKKSAEIAVKEQFEVIFGE